MHEMPRSVRECVRRRGVLVLITLLSAGVGFSVSAADFYASPTGTTSTAAGTGTITNPWALQTALAHPAAVHPGDTIWLRGGTYVGRYNSYLSGTTSQPIIVRQYSGERARIDGGPGPLVATLMIYGQNSWYWGFEVFSSSTTRRSTQDGSGPSDLNRGAGVFTAQDAGHPGLKLINLIIHDASEGMSLWEGATDMEIRGNIIYNCGWDGATDRGHGHGIYTQNRTGTKRISDNIIFNQYGEGINIYGSASAYLDNIQVTGNTLFDNGEPSIYGYQRNLLFGGEGSRAADNGNVLNNYTLYRANGPTTGVDFGYSAGISNFVIRDNVFVSMTTNSTTFGGTITNLAMTGNGFYRNVTGVSESTYTLNTYYHATKPTGTFVYVRPNGYEVGRANITIFNWDRNASVAVDVSGVLTVGSSYEVRNAQDFFGPPVLSGVYPGGSLTLPMTGLTVAAPIGAAAPAPTGPDFNVFVVLTPSALPPPQPAASFSFGPAAPQTNVAVTFADTSTGGPTTWQWSFGDGGTSTLRNPTHTYAVAGAYTVMLTATNAGGSSQTTQSVTVTAPPVPTAATRFYTVTPCRVIDTRMPDGPTGGPVLAANGTRVFSVAGSCGIPLNATAVSTNVTVVNPKAAGQLRVYPGNTGVPPTSAINFLPGQTRANNSMVVLSTDGTGTISVRNDAPATVGLAVDINGYFR
jgi:PKD repeat protein